MQYMLLIYEDERVYGGPKKNGPALQEMMAKHMAFAPTLGYARKGGAGPKGTASATTVRASDGKRTVHDGPFAETKEQLGGYYLVDVPDLDAAIVIANRLPLSPGGAVEIRPLLRDE
jgi:hypothetical protein